MTGAAAKTMPAGSNRMNQPAPMTVGGTTRTNSAPLPAAHSSNLASRPARLLLRAVSSLRRMATSASDSAADSVAAAAASSRLVAAASRTRASVARRPRSASRPATTVAAIGPATNRTAAAISTASRAVPAGDGRS